MSQVSATQGQSLPTGRPVVFRNATVLTIDPSLGAIEHGDVLVVDKSIAAVGPQLAVPEGTVEIDASGGILMPGMVDTHRHMWQTALRGYGADWTLTNYFYYYYIDWGKYLPRRRCACRKSPVSAIEAVDAGVTTSVTGRMACRRWNMPTRRLTRWKRCRAVSSSPMATCLVRPGSGRRTPEFARLHQTAH